MGEPRADLVGPSPPPAATRPSRRSCLVHGARDGSRAAASLVSRCVGSSRSRALLGLEMTSRPRPSPRPARLDGAARPGSRTNGAAAGRAVAGVRRRPSVAWAGAVAGPHGLYLSGGATLPEARDTGCYRALVAARWDDAVRRGTPALHRKLAADPRALRLRRRLHDVRARKRRASRLDA